MRRASRPIVALSTLLAALLLPSGAGGVDEQHEVPNPCLTEAGAKLRCPDLQMRRPFDLWVEPAAGGRVRLHASSAIKSRGKGPVEVRGHRTGKREMEVRQHIHRVRGESLTVEPGGELYFYFIPGQGRYWKFHQAARFEIWSLDADRERKRLMRIGPKLNYCLRDLALTHSSPRTPKHRVYPGCSQDPGKRAVTLGTSVGWSDIYPSTYHENWIDVTGLRGCYAFVERADPKNHIFESHEDNNEAQRVVRLPFERGPGRCP
jgi:hypothetical protein